MCICVYMYTLYYCIAQGYKQYRASALLGVATDTLDSTGAVTHTSPCAHITPALLASHLPSFTGHILQTPPMYSALHHDGKRLYKLARAGVVVARPPREVEVRRLVLLDGPDDGKSGHIGEICANSAGICGDNGDNREGFSDNSVPAFSLEMETSGGFYVRSLISDIGNAM
jgi:tRNA pseudouridine55 synthase